MIKQFNVDTLRELAVKLNEHNVHKENIIQIVYTGDERMNWVVFYWEDKK